MREKSYPGARQAERGCTPEIRDCAGVVVPLELNIEGHLLALVSTTTVFGTPVDITLSELALESFFPADAATADTLRHLSER
jgi:hypothetical protein